MSKGFYLNDFAVIVINIIHGRANLYLILSWLLYCIIDDCFTVYWYLLKWSTVLVILTCFRIISKCRKGKWISSFCPGADLFKPIFKALLTYLLVIGKNFNLWHLWGFMEIQMSGSLTWGCRFRSGIRAAWSHTFLTWDLLRKFILFLRTIT